ncbi:MAG TPA: HEAT repeat domain-containing protein, partial [Phototrophicaceae bacterium]|nr:HEAT repeat domain-containing protein [Phototrophicaceae bacterium]
QRVVNPQELVGVRRLVKLGTGIVRNFFQVGAANALGTIGDVSAVPYLLPLLKQSNPQLVVWAAFALTRLGHDHFSFLETALQSTEVDVRRSAILAMQQLGDSRAIAPLLRVCDDPSRRFETDSTVAEAATKALISLGYNIGNLPPSSH